MTIELLIALTYYSSRELEGHVVMVTNSELLDEAISEIDNSWYEFQGGVKSFIAHHNATSKISKIDFKPGGVLVLQSV